MLQQAAQVQVVEDDGSEELTGQFKALYKLLNMKMDAKMQARDTRLRSRNWAQVYEKCGRSSSPWWKDEPGWRTSQRRDKKKHGQPNWTRHRFNKWRSE